MNARHLFVIAMLLATPLGAADPGAPADVLQPVIVTDEELSQFRWEKRLVVVFADSPDDPRFMEQLRLLEADAPALALRDVVVLTDTDPAAKTALRTELRPRGFSLVIVGKDGQSIIRKPLPWSVREISRSIDKMPMRLQEIRDNLRRP